MKVKDILNQKVSYFDSPSKSGTPKNTISMINFLTEAQVNNKAKVDYVRRLNEKDEKEAKKYKINTMPCCTISGLFSEHRYAMCCTSKTGVIAIDIDKDDNEGLDIEETKKKLMELPYVFLAMKSCRGEGVFCLIYYNRELEFRYVFNALNEEFLNLGYIIDDGCSDICRLRIVSWDDNILIKNDVEEYNKFKADEIIEDRNYTEEEWKMTKEDLMLVVKCIYILVNNLDYVSNDYNEWLLDGFRLATIPNAEVGLRLFLMISERSDNYKGKPDVEQKFRECRRTTTYKTNILGYYINKVKDAYGDDWIKKVNNILTTNNWKSNH